MARKNVFLVGLDDFNRETLRNLSNQDSLEIHAALTLDEMRGPDALSIEQMIETATQRMKLVPGGPHGVASFFDFPGTLLAAYLAHTFDLPGPGIDAVMKCEHKYWSRLEQQKVIPDNIPAFRVFDPMEDPDELFSRLGLVPPFWIKPVKSFRSFLAFNIQDQRQFAGALDICRNKGASMTDAFSQLMTLCEVPLEFREMKESFIAETPISGAQCTLECYAHNGDIVVYGIVDSVREPDGPSFSRYEYPSILPLEVQHRMMDVTRTIMKAIGFLNGCFNVEFFYDQTGDHVWLLEINPRPSQSHADLFYKVHGMPHFALMLDLALGRKPKPMQRVGEFNVAAHFFVRAFEPGIVAQAPTRDAITRIQRRQPGTRIKVDVRRGDDLSKLELQDSYSFELANVYIGARDRLDVLDKYDQVLTALQFEIEGKFTVS